MKKKAPKTADAEFRLLLKKYKCPVAFYEVKTRFLGNIASPNLHVSPAKTVQDLWDGELPEFDDEASAQALFDALIGGLWNQLTRHQNRRHPFHLTRMSKPMDHASVKRYLIVRQAEIEGFVTGLYGDEEIVYLPERAHEALEHLSSVRSFLLGLAEFPDEGDPVETGNELVQLTKIAEQEMNALILSCTESRRRALQSKSFPKPTLH